MAAEYTVCAIAGLLLTTGQGDAACLARLVVRMLDLMQHRGPDDRGHEVIALPDHRLGLGNCRLAIQDPSPLGHQPMHDPATGNWIVFNGEIYNFPELQRELTALGSRFRSGTDTEVLLHGYARWEIGLLRRLRGQFAFALWDADRARLLIARDRLGEKPLYYHQQPGSFAFASEVRALVHTGLAPRRVCPQGLFAYLALGAVGEPLTLIEGVRALPAGHFGIWQAGTFTTQAYWTLPPPPSALEWRSRAAIVAELRDRLAEAVRLQLISDRPIGAFLSGGVDSTVIVALMRHALDAPPHTISIVFAEREFSEAPTMRATAQRLGTQHTEVLLTGDDLLDCLPRALAAMDQPTFDGINTYVVSRSARQAGLTVALSGVGGDELFAGYPSFRVVPWLERARRWLPRPMRPLVSAGARGLLRDSDRGRKLARWFADRDLDGGAYLLVRELFAPSERRRLAPAAELIGARATAPRAGRGRSSVRAIARSELAHYMRNVLLRDTDAMSMAHSLEVRVPFLDHTLVEFVSGLPAPLLEPRGRPKALLLEALGEVVPPDSVPRRKMGFTLPWQRWLHGPLRREVEATLLDPRVGGALAPLLEPAALAAVWARFLAGRSTWVRPWSLYVLKQWGERNL